jgi:hypothetical protein
MLPLLIYLVLKIFGLVDSIYLKSVRERRTPLLAYCVLILTLLRLTRDSGQLYELYYFLVGACLASFTAFILSYFSYKISLHMIGIGGLTAGVIMMLMVYGISAGIILPIFLVVAGLTASARLYVSAHKNHELLTGYALGIGSQLILIPQYF